MASKFVQQNGRYFFLSNSISAYTRSASGAAGRVSTVASKSIPSRSAASSTNYFFTNKLGSATIKDAAPPKLGIFGFTSSSISSLTRLPSVRAHQPLPPAPTFLDTLKASFFPSSFRGTTRSYATFRDLGYQGRAGGSGGSSSGGLFQYFKMPLLFTAGVCAFNYFVLPYLFQIPGANVIQRNPQYIIYGLIGANVAVFLAWKSPRSFGRQLYRYGLLHKDAQFNKWQMLGSAFSHQEIWHLGINMFVLYQFGGPLAKWVGSKNFLEMYLDSAAIASLGSIALPVLLNRFTRLIVLSNVPSLGASGAIFSLFGTFAYLAPYTRLSLFFIPLPIGAWYVFLLTMGYNGLGMKFNWARTDYAGHFAGCAAGILFGYIFSEKMKRQREEQQRRLSSFRVF